MSFADRLQKFPAMNASWRGPQKDRPLSLCVPRVLELNGVGQALVGIEAAPVLAGGVGALRLLSALVDLLEEPEKNLADHEAHARELAEAAKALREHLDATAAESDQAHAMHQAQHQHEKGGLH